MTLLIINRIVCHQTSGGQIQLKIGNLELLPATTFSANDDKIVTIITDVSGITDLMIPIDLYDMAFSVFNHAQEINLPRAGEMVTFDYNNPVLADEDFINIRGKYDIFYQVTEPTGGEVRVMFRKVFSPAKQLVS